MYVYLRLPPINSIDELFCALTQEALRRYTARQLRLAFLVQRWDLKVDFTDSQMTGEIRTMERTFDVRNTSSNLTDPAHTLNITEILYQRKGDIS